MTTLHIDVIKVMDILHVQVRSKGRELQRQFTQEEFHEYIDNLWPHLGEAIQKMKIDVEF
jgi:hypothetical protein